MSLYTTILIIGIVVMGLTFSGFVVGVWIGLRNKRRIHH